MVFNLKFRRDKFRILLTHREVIELLYSPISFINLDIRLIGNVEQILKLDKLNLHIRFETIMITSESSNERDMKHNVEIIKTLALKHSGIITILNFITHDYFQII